MQNKKFEICSRLQHCVPVGNRFDMQEADLNSVYDPSLHDALQEAGEQIFDSAIDAHVDFSVSKNPVNFAAFRVSVMRVMAAHKPDEDEGRPVVKIDLPVAKQVVLGPCCLVEGHWSLLAIDVESNVVHLLDSLYVADKGMLLAIRKLLAGLAFYYHCDNLLNAELHIWATHSYQCRGRVDCGAWVSYFCQQLTQRKELDPQISMIEYRKKMRVDILQHLNTAPST